MVLFGVSQAGNAFFQQQRHQQSADEYNKAIEVKVEDKAFNAVLYCNRAAAYHAMNKYIDAIADCFTASALDASYVRVLQRRADAYVAIGDHTNAAQVTMLTVLLCTTRQWHCAVHPTGVAGHDLVFLLCMLPVAPALEPAEDCIVVHYFFAVAFKALPQSKAHCCRIFCCCLKRAGAT